MTFKGHRVQKSLIRAKFSPAASTAQRYIATGCATGRLISKNISFNSQGFPKVADIHFHH